MAESPIVWDESMPREGCLCGHGQYGHRQRWGDLVGRRQGCLHCSCERFTRDTAGDLCGFDCAYVKGHDGPCVPSHRLALGVPGDRPEGAET